MTVTSQLFEPGLEIWPRIAWLRRRLSERPESVRTVVVGAGASGLAAVRLLATRGAPVRVLDDRPRDRLSPQAQAALETTEVLPLDGSTVDDADLVVLSPGVPRRRPELRSAIAEGRLIGEIELASWHINVPLIGITGTNGKSTTTALVAHILERAGRRVFAGGNLGRPLSELPLLEPVDVAVVELSSYQLESVVEAHFRVGCWLNLTPDHLDRYESVEEYTAAKRRLVERRSINGTAVLNADDPIVRNVGRRLGGGVRWFSIQDKDERASTLGTFMSDPGTARRRYLRGIESYRIDSPALIGPHNHSNACAAIECARFVDASAEAVQDGLSSFSGLPHRLEQVGVLGSTVFYNDSKATNVDAAVTAVRAVAAPIWLIAGGVDKGGAWAPLVEAARGRVERVFAIGDAAPIVSKAFAPAGIGVENVGTLERAVAAAGTFVREGGSPRTVLLAPACASFDQFANFAARGDAFRAAVARLVGLVDSVDSVDSVGLVEGSGKEGER